MGSAFHSQCNRSSSISCADSRFVIASLREIARCRSAMASNVLCVCALKCLLSALTVLSVAGKAVNIPCAVALPFQCVALCVVAVPFADVAFALLLRFVCGRICCGGYRNYCGRQSLRASTRDLSAFRAFVEQKGAIDETNDEDTQYGAESVHTSQMAAARMDACILRHSMHRCCFCCLFVEHKHCDVRTRMHRI